MRAAKAERDASLMERMGGFVAVVVVAAVVSMGPNEHTSTSSTFNFCRVATWLKTGHRVEISPISKRRPPNTQPNYPLWPVESSLSALEILLTH